MPLKSGKLRIGMLGVEDPADVGTYSGTPFYLAHFLRQAGHEVRTLGPYPLRHRTLLRVQNRLLRQFAGRDLLWERHPWITRQYPEIVSRYVEHNPDLDLLLATSLFPGAGVKTSTPLVFWADTSVAGLMGEYPRYRGLSERTQLRSHAVEQDALTACRLAIFSNQWAADVALATYDLDPAKVRVIRYGANLFAAPDERELQRLLALRSPEKIRLISIGVDWQRKGMTKAMEITGELRQRGLDAELQIVGCRPPDSLVIPSYVTLMGSISKKTLAGARRLEELLGASHLLLLPTQAECAAVVLAEASAYGVPFLTTAVGGNASLVQPNVNGFLLPLLADVHAWADAALSMLLDRAAYERLAWNAHDFFQRHLSWQRAIASFETAASDLSAAPAAHNQPAALLSSLRQPSKEMRL